MSSFITPVHPKLTATQDATVTPRIVATEWFSNVSTSVAATPMWTPIKTGLYRVSVDMMETGGGAGNTFTIDTKIAYTDLVGAVNTTVAQQIASAVPEIKRSYGTMVFEAKAGVPITFEFVITSGAGAPVVNFRLALEELG